jgi:hypothetical protein
MNMTDESLGMAESLQVEPIEAEGPAVNGNGVDHEEPGSDAPKGFTKEAIRDWAATPETVRADTTRRIEQLLRGLEKHRKEAQRLAGLWEPIAPFDEMARQTGTTLPAAMLRYIRMEQALRQEPIGGLIHVCQQMGINPFAAAHVILQHAPQQQPAEPPPPSFVRPNVEEKARLSVSGSPSGPPSSARKLAGSPREAVSRAFEQVGIRS